LRWRGGPAAGAKIDDGKTKSSIAACTMADAA
jgi:hypothetical protein